MTRVLLVNPPFYRMMGSHYNGLPLGIAYIASYLNRAGHEAWVYNADFQAKKDYATPHTFYEESERNLAALHQPSPVVNECIESILAFAPDIIGYNCYTATLPIIAQISAAIRERLPETPQVVGGPHPTLDKKILNHLFTLDYAVRGEGEEVLLDLANGVRLQSTCKAPRIEYLDTMPYPERQKLWAGEGRPMTGDEKLMVDVCAISTARGCPWRCNYCASPLIWPKVIARNTESVVQEVAFLNSNHPGMIHFVDDTFTYNHRRALSIMDGIIGLGVPIEWRCEARADTITTRLAVKMRESGCRCVKVGIESGSERILKAMNKGESRDEMLRGVGMLQAEGISVTAYLMSGFPGETAEDLRETIVFARRIGADTYSVSMVAPYYGTKLYRDAVALGLPVDKAPWECFFHQNNSMLLNKELPRDLIEELWSLSDK
jgi:anaerobic magnesium-protoporphyrin IX monomethyl ester cyclase